MKANFSKFLFLVVIMVNFVSIGFVLGNNVLNEREKEKGVIDGNKPEIIENSYEGSRSTGVGNKNTKSSNKNNNLDHSNINNVNQDLSSPNMISKPPNMIPRYSYVDTGSGLILHYVDQQSNVDSSSDQGFHDTFAELKDTDGIYDNITDPGLSNITLINGESFEGSFPPSGWSETGSWNDESSIQAFDGTLSADFDGSGSNSGYLTTLPMDTSDAIAIYIEFYYQDDNLDNNDFELELFDGISWDTDYVGLDELGPEDNWNFYSEKITDPQYLIPNFQIRWYAETVDSGEHAYVDFVTVKKESSLNLEIQFVDVPDFLGPEELAIKTGSLSNNDLGIQYWTGSDWITITNTLNNNSWNNFTVSVVSSTYTIRFVESGPDTIQDWWEIDSILLNIKGSGSKEYVPTSDTSNVDSTSDIGYLTSFANMQEIDAGDAVLQETANTGQISFIDSVQATSSTETVVLPAPTVSDGDFMVAIIMMSDDSPSITMTTIPTNWNEAVGKTNMDTPASSPPVIWVYTKVASGESGTYTWSGDQTAGSTGVLFVFRGVDSTLGTNGIINTAKSAQTGTGNNPTAPSIATAVDDTVIAFAWTDTSQTVTSFPTADGLTNEETIATSSGGNGGTVSAGIEGNITGTTSGPYSWTTSATDERSAFTMNIRPKTSSIVYQLDQEIQWTGIAHFLEEEELKIKTGPFSGGENLSVDYWSGSSWVTLISSLNANSWNNISIKSYLDSINFTIRFRDGNNISDSIKNDWSIDTAIIYVNTPDISSPIVNNLGLNDYGNGTALIWADITDDGNLGVINVTLTINSSDVYMNNSGSFWTYQLPVSFGQLLTYQIKNASDFSNNYISSRFPLTPYNYTFNLVDNITPNVVTAIYNGTEGYNGTFKTTVNDDWGVIDTVFVNVTSCAVSSTCIGSNIAVLKWDGSQYINNSILMKSGPIDYTITVNDTFGNSFTSGEYSGVVQNKAPSIADVFISPDFAFTNDSLEASWNFTDIDDDSESAIINITWYKNGIYISAYNNLTSLPSTATIKGESWHFLIQVSDGQLFSDTFNSSDFGESSTIINSIPIVTYANISNLFPFTSDNLIAIWEESDLDGIGDIDSGIINITWYRNGSKISSYDNKTQVNATDTLKGEAWNYILQIYDGENFSNPLNSTVANIQNTIPTATDVKFNITNPFDSDNFEINYTFIDADIGDSPGNPIVWWFIKNVYNSSYDNKTIIYGTNTTLNDWFYYVIQIYDGSAYSGNITSDGIIIGGTGSNTEPQVSELAINPTVAKTSDDLMASYTYFDAEGHPETGSQIRWYKNGDLQPEFNDKKIIPNSATNKNETWYFTVNVKDIFIFNGTFIVSPNITIVNTEPTAFNFELTPNPLNSTDLIASWSFLDIDTGDVQTFYNLTWYKNNAFQPTLSNSTLVLAGNTSKNDIWYFILQVYDGESFSVNYNSSNYGVVRVILNTAPTAASLRFDNPLPKTGDVLIANWTFYDLDYDSEDFSWQIYWYKNNQLAGLLNNSRIIESGNTSKNQVWYFELRVFDGTNYSILYKSPSIQIQNTVPLVTDLEITDVPTTSDAIVASWDAYYYDADGDSRSTVFNITWFKNGLHLSTYDGQTTIPNSVTTKGDIWYYLLQVNDGTSYSITFNSTTFGKIAEILNSIPTLSNVYFLNSNPTVADDLISDWIYNDYDGDIENETIFNLTWYKNGIYQPIYDNLTILPFAASITKGELWSYIVQVFDGENFSISYNSSIAIIINSRPFIDYVSISEGNLVLYSNNDLDLFWNYTDADGDIIDSSGLIITWIRNGQIDSRFHNFTLIPNSAVNKHDSWTVEIQIFDSDVYSSVFEFGPVIIQNSEGSVSTVSINNNANSINTSSNLVLTWNFNDLDPEDRNKDEIVTNRNITWYKWDLNQSLWIYYPEFDNNTIIPSESTFKHEQWYANINIFDGNVWSQYNTSMSIEIVNTVPLVTNFEFLASEFQYFYTEDEDIRINYDFSDIDDDFDNSTIMWFINGVYQPQYNNQTVIYSNQTAPGQIWSAQVIPRDNEGSAIPVFSSERTIEDVPKFESVGFIGLNDTEGHYFFWFDVQANPVNPSGPARPTVILNIIINNSESDFVIANWNGTHFVFDWQYTNYSLIGSEIFIIAEATTRVFYSGYSNLISQYHSFNFTFQDTAPPRVTGVNIEYDDPKKPTELTFIVTVEEFGSLIENATLYYSFEPISDSGSFTISGSQNSNNRYIKLVANESNLEGYNKIELQALNETHYMANVDFNSEKSVVILFHIQLSDQSGNLNLNAWPQGNNIDETFRYLLPTSGIPPEELGIYAIIIFAIVLIFSFIINKKFRSKELVGLDVESVLNNMNKLKPTEIAESINFYSLGVVISFFDQRHGPLPVMYEPIFLRDNYNVLLDLADISFSTGRFVSNFTDEEQSSFTFSFDPLTQIKVLSYSFSLNRPEARGGAENLILKIMLPKEVFPLISQFGSQIKNIVYKIHRILDSDLPGKEKEKISMMLIEIRELVAKIALSHLDLYGSIKLETNELWESYDGEIS